MKKPQELHDELTKKLVTENYVDLKPINKIEATPKSDWEAKYLKFINEAGKPDSLKPIVNNDMKTNTKEAEDKIKADPKLKFEMDNKLAGSYKVSNEVENIESHNYDYSPKVDNINNVNAQEMMNGVYCEVKNDPQLSLSEAQAKAIKNLAGDPLYYVKNGMFGVEGLGYVEPKVQENDGETYGGSGYSAKLKDSPDAMQIVKESVKDVLKEHNIGGVAIGGGNPNSIAKQMGDYFTQMMEEHGLNDGQVVKEENKEKDLPMDEAKEDEVDEARQQAIEASQEAAGMEEEARPDYADVDGDGDEKESMKKAFDDKKKKAKKESIETKLAEIGKEAESVKLEAQLDFLHEYIDEKLARVNSINEDENLKELIDKKKMKDMQKEIKLLEKRKDKMEKIYEKSCGKAYKRKEMVDETAETAE
tara:strand:+ start:897 stop:2153 length:1257 start_codon:yes stop_codon:yes gene_type:complete